MKREDKKIWRAIMMISQIGITMMTPIFLSAFIGYQLDKWLNTQYWFIIFIVLGVCAAFRSVYIITKNFYLRDLKEEEAQQKYFDDLKKQRETCSDDNERYKD
ncbi:AtpZ/AtpI family protein [Velocimicrobium porci]|uniref:AtpZ/AtpI family protein n=1 Tax=Velocimicrobium porci TaxID=2606634 RepID=A0A6L5XVM5_9FIRM|nr:AtpZ/AtpI family protein [Velocimicrobium porci]MSS62886.1 AtpZ/AtpI family protein [Velocimicrobium porci]